MCFLLTYAGARGLEKNGCFQACEPTGRRMVKVHSTEESQAASPRPSVALTSFPLFPCCRSRRSDLLHSQMDRKENSILPR